MPTGIWLYAYFGLWGLALFEALLLMAITRQVGDFHAYWVTDDADQGLPAGAQAPLLPERDLYGRTLPPIAAGRARVLLFISKGCSACHDAMKFVPEAAASTAFDLVLIVGNTDDAARVFMGEFRREGAFPDVLVFADEERTTFEQYRVTVTPYAMVVDDGGAVRAKGVASKQEHLDRIVRQGAVRTLRLERVSKERPDSVGSPA